MSSPTTNASDHMGTIVITGLVRWVNGTMA